MAGLFGVVEYTIGLELPSNPDILLRGFPPGLAHPLFLPAWCFRFPRPTTLGPLLSRAQPCLVRLDMVVQTSQQDKPSAVLSGNTPVSSSWSLFIFFYVGFFVWCLRVYPLFFINSS